MSGAELVRVRCLVVCGGEFLPYIVRTHGYNRGFIVDEIYMLYDTTTFNLRPCALITPGGVLDTSQGVGPTLAVLIPPPGTPHFSKSGPPVERRPFCEVKTFL